MPGWEPLYSPAALWVGKQGGSRERLEVAVPGAVVAAARNRRDGQNVPLRRSCEKAGWWSIPLD
jgi:hypothetical protein